MKIPEGLINELECSISPGFVKKGLTSQLENIENREINLSKEKRDCLFEIKELNKRDSEIKEYIKFLKQIK